MEPVIGSPIPLKEEGPPPLLSSSMETSPTGSSHHVSVVEPKPAPMPTSTTKALTNKERIALTEKRKDVELGNAFQQLLGALRDKRDVLPVGSKPRLKIEADIDKLHRKDQAASDTQSHKEFEISCKKELIALDPPKLTKMGKVASLLAGFVLGVGIAALVVGLVSNPVGWAIIGAGVLAVAAVLLYQRSQGTAKQAAGWALGGAVLGGLGTGLAGAGLLGAAAPAAAGAMKSAGAAVTTFAQTSVYPALQSIASKVGLVLAEHAGGIVLGLGLVGLVGGTVYYKAADYKRGRTQRLERGRTTSTPTQTETRTQVKKQASVESTTPPASLPKYTKPPAPKGRRKTGSSPTDIPKANPTGNPSSPPEGEQTK